ncbi:MAG: hypothetical protein ABW352_18185 [Polyangiales bacterium]
MIFVRWLLVLQLLACSSALAQEEAAPSGPEQEASVHFERGVQLYKEQAFRAAVIEFQRAYDLAPDYRLLYNLGRTKFQLQDYLGAAQSFEPYLEQGGADIPSERRAQVEEALTSLKTRVARVSVEVNRGGAEVYVDELKVGTAPLASLVLINVGRHRISARAADGAVDAEFIEVAGGDLAQVKLTLEAPASAPLQARDEQAPLARERWSARRKLALGALVTGGALLAASVATGVLALRDQDRLQDQVDTLGVDRDAVRDQRSKVDTLSLTTDVLIGAGAGFAVTGLVLWLVSGERTERASQASLRLDAGFGSLAVHGRF